MTSVSCGTVTHILTLDVVLRRFCAGCVLLPSITSTHQQGRAADNDVPFQVRDTPEGIRVLIGDDDAAAEWQGVLDFSWGIDPQPFFRVDRIDVSEGECWCFYEDPREH